MFLRVLTSTKIYIVILIPLLAIMLWLKTILAVKLVSLPSDSFQMPFYTIIFEQLQKLHLPRLLRIISLILMIFQAFLIARLNFKYNIIEEKKSYLPSFIFIIIASSFIQLQRFHPIFISNIFLIYAIDIVFGSRKRENAIPAYFNASFLISLASLFYVNFIFYVIIIWISLIILRPFNWREWVSSIFGFITPILFLELYYIVFENSPKDLLITALLNLLFSNFKSFFNPSYYLFFGYILILILLASYYMLNVYNYKNISSRQFFLIFLAIFILALLIFYFVPSASVELLPIIALPVSFILSSHLSSIKNKWLAESILIILIGLIIFIQVVN